MIVGLALTTQVVLEELFFQLFLRSLLVLDPICFLCEGKLRMVVDLYVKQSI